MDDSYGDAMLEELRAIRRLLESIQERASSDVYNVHVTGTEVDNDRLQKVVDDFRRR